MASVLFVLKAYQLHVKSLEYANSHPYSDDSITAFTISGTLIVVGTIVLIWLYFYRKDYNADTELTEKANETEPNLYTKINPLTVFEDDDEIEKVVEKKYVYNNKSIANIDRSNPISASFKGAITRNNRKPKDSSRNHDSTDENLNFPGRYVKPENNLEQLMALPSTSLHRTQSIQSVGSVLRRKRPPTWNYGTSLAPKDLVKHDLLVQEIQNYSESRPTSQIEDMDYQRGPAPFPIEYYFGEVKPDNRMVPLRQRSLSAHRLSYGNSRNSDLSPDYTYVFDRIPNIYREPSIRTSIISNYEVVDFEEYPQYNRLQPHDHFTMPGNYNVSMEYAPNQEYYQEHINPNYHVSEML